MSAYEAAILDFYDDRGSLLREAVPDPDDLPDFVKSASVVSQESHSNQFALVLVEDGRVMKKFATADLGNTWLSALYFAHTKDNLPDEAVKVAAANLIDAFEGFGEEAPELLWEIAEGPAGTNMVDVGGKRPKTKIAHEEEPVTYAIERADGSKYYPLKDNAASVKVADDYFQRNKGQFVPRERREYAVKVAQVARKADWPVSEDLAHYASEDYNPALEGYMTARYTHLMDVGAHPEARKELMKLASARQSLSPAAFAVRLEEFDRDNGIDALWDRWVPDPYYSTFGLEKEAKGAASPPATWTIGEVTVTQDELENLAQRNMKFLQSNFGQDFATAYLKDPVTQFEALPLPMKKLVARMATTTSDSLHAG